MNSFFALFYFLLLLLSSVFGQAPWPQRYHDFQFSNRANNRTLSPSLDCLDLTRYDNFTTILLPSQQTVLTSGHRNQSLVFNSTAFLPLSTVPYSVFAVSNDGQIQYYNITSLLDDNIIIGAFNISSQSTIWTSTLSGSYGEIGFNNFLNTIEVISTRKQYEHHFDTPINLFHINATNGDLIWTKVIGFELYPQLYLFGGDPVNGNILIGFGRSTVIVMCINNSGNITWTSEIPNRVDSYANPLYLNSIVSDNQVLIVEMTTEYQIGLVGISTQNGDKLWNHFSKFESNEITTMALLEETGGIISPVVVGSKNGVAVFDPVSGKVLIESEADPIISVSSIISIGKQIMLGGFRSEFGNLILQITLYSDGMWMFSVFDEFSSYICNDLAVNQLGQLFGLCQLEVNDGYSLLQWTKQQWACE